MANTLLPIAVAALFVVVILVNGYLSSLDIARCEANGHSRAVCFATINP